MKYSVLTIFLATGYIALVVAAVQPPDSWWRHVATLAWLAMVAYLFVLAADPLRRPRAVFGRVALGCIAAYLAMPYLPNAPADLLPHQWFATWWAPAENATLTFNPAVSVVNPYGGGGSPGSPYGAGGGFANLNLVASQERGHVVETIAAMNTALVFGLLGGLLGLMRYGRAERIGAKTPPAGCATRI